MRALLLTLALFSLPLLACAVPEEMAQLMVDLGIQADASFTVAEDGAAELGLSLGSAMRDEEGDPVLDCSDLDTADLGPDAYVEREQRGDAVWCHIISPYPDLSALQAEAAEDPSESGLHCLALRDGVFYLDLSMTPPDPAEEGEAALPFPFRVTFPGPIRTHNAALQEGNTLTWMMDALPPRLLINLEEGDPCPGTGVVLAITFDAAGGGTATLTIPLPNTGDDELAAAFTQRLKGEGWQVRVSGAPQTGQEVSATRAAAPADVADFLDRAPGFAGGGSDLSLRINRGDAQALLHQVEITLDTAGFAEFWAAMLPVAPTPTFTLLLRPAGVLEEASGDWATATAPLVLHWDPASSPSVLRARAVSRLAAPAGPEPPAEAQPAAATEPVTATEPLTATLAPTEPLAPAAAPVTQTVAATGSAAPAPAVAPAPAAPAATRTGLPLCPEALLGSGGGFDAARLAAAGITDLQRTGILINDDFLLPDFQQAVREHNRRYPGSPAYVSVGVSSLYEVLWFYSNGSVLGRPFDSQFVTGQERTLRDHIVAESAARERRGGDPHLTPGEVFELSLGLNDGSVSQALLTAHNLLRALARGDGTSTANTFESTAGLIRVGRDLDFFSDHLAQVRADPDQGGPWYHFFGTAYMELSARGSTGFYLGGGLLGNLPGLGVGAILDGLNRNLSSTGTTMEARAYNEAEQFVREYWNSRVPDPEKYCFNVWGAQIGAMLFDDLPFRATRLASGEAFSTFTPPDVEQPAFAPAQSAARACFLNVIQPRFSVQWEDVTGRAVYEVGPGAYEGRLLGSPSMPVVPVPAGESWALLWLSPDDRSQTVTFEAMEDGAVLRYTRVDLETGAAAHYETAVPRAGDHLSVTYGGSTAQPLLAGPDGSPVEPETFVVEAIRAAQAAAGGTAGEAVDDLALPADPFPRLAALDNFRIRVERLESHEGQIELSEDMEFLFARTPGAFGYDYAAFLLSEDTDLGETEHRHYLTGDVEAEWDGERWQAQPRRPESDPGRVVSHLPYEEFGLAVLALPDMVYAGDYTYDAVEADEWELPDVEVPAPGGAEGLTLVYAWVGAAKEGGFLVTYEVDLVDAYGGETSLYYIVEALDERPEDLDPPPDALAP